MGSILQGSGVMSMLVAVSIFVVAVSAVTIYWAVSAYKNRITPKRTAKEGIEWAKKKRDEHWKLSDRQLTVICDYLKTEHEKERRCHKRAATISAIKSFLEYSEKTCGTIGGHKGYFSGHSFAATS